MEKNLKNLGNVLLGLTGVHVAQGLGCDLGLSYFHLSRLLAVQWSVLESASALRVHFWFDFQALSTVCPHHPLWQHLAEILYQAFGMVFLNSDCATCYLSGAPPGFDKPPPVSLCGQRDIVFLGSQISAGKAQSHRDVIAAVGWRLDCNLSSSSLHLSLSFSLLLLLS